MTTQSAERILRTVQATVAGHEIYNGKPTIKLTIPAWGSQYPTVLYNATPEQQILLPMGATLNVILEQNRLREGKDPTKMFNYFWSFIGISDGPPDPGISAATGVSQVSRERSIQRQVALKAAVKVRGFEDDPQNIIQTAQAFFDWLSEEGQGQTAPPSNGTAAQHPAQPNPRPPAETGNPPAPPNSRPPAKTGNPPAAAAPPTSPAAPIPPDPVHASLQNRLLELSKQQGHDEKMVRRIVDKKTGATLENLTLDQLQEFVDAASTKVAAQQAGQPVAR